MTEPDPSSDPDAALLSAARAGDRGALERLIERQQARIYRFGLRMCRDPEVARDVVQETSLALARGIREFRGDASLSTWLYTVARSFCVKARRRSKFAPAEVDSLDTPAAARLADPAPGTDDALAARRLEREVRAAIDGLAPTSREVLILRDVEGLTAPEVAAVLGLGVEAVKSRLHRARLEVRAKVAPALGLEPAAPRPRTCPDVTGVFSRYLEGDVSPEACAEMERHLAACPHCRGACDGLRQVLGLCKATPAEVPAEVQRRVQRALRALVASDP